MADWGGGGLALETVPEGLMGFPELTKRSIAGIFYPMNSSPVLSFLVCQKCKNSLTLEHFHKDATRSTGLKGVCRLCAAKRTSDSRKADPERWRQYGRATRTNNFMKTIIQNTKARARRKGLLFDLDEHIDEIKHRIEAGRCELSGLQFEMGRGLHWASPSIDRIDTNGPYLYSNIRVILHGLNTALSNWGEDVLIKMVNALQVENKKRKNAGLLQRI